MAKTYLSKSTFIKGVQCEKALYLHKYNRELADDISPQQQAVFESGTSVGLLAQELFPQGVDASPKDYSQYFQSFKYTLELINKGVEVIYEAGFFYDNVMCFVDVLVKEKEGWHAYEVKSSTKITDTYIIDASLQYHVIKNSGLDLVNISIIHIDNSYVRSGAIDPKKLFQLVLVTQHAIDKQNYIKDKLTILHGVLSQDSIPNIDIGPHCASPYDCNFKGYCWQGLPSYSIFDLSRLNKKIKWNLYNRGVVDINQIPINVGLSDNQKIEVDAYVNKKEIIHKFKIREFVNSLSDNIFYLDFETYQSAIPPFSNVKPYQQIPFQYSAHYERNQKMMHVEFLAKDAVTDCREKFIQHLIDDMQEDGDILVYNIGFERSRLRELIAVFPQYKIPLQAIINRMKDLMIPFKEKWYYLPSMKGSYSIKSVLPALSSMSYDDLEINNGGLASVTFANMHIISNQDSLNVIRKNLLEYCKRDTLAMVEILNVLKMV
ncbi:MAG: hypothetical protein CMD23_01370 [Flavobacteriales bacterium]|nr:hypothetical protein [Flavobacteriales bacterium]